MTHPNGKRQRTTQHGNNDQVVDFTQVRAQKLRGRNVARPSRHLLQATLPVCLLGHRPFLDAPDRIHRPERGRLLIPDSIRCRATRGPKTPRPRPSDPHLLQPGHFFSRCTSRIQNSRPSIENNRRYVRFGCSVEKSTQSFAAYLQFVRFLKTYLEHAHKDPVASVSVFYSLSGTRPLLGCAGSESE